MRSFLMISPYFVPMNFVGAKRALHLARHLPARGWSPAVVALPPSMDPDPALEPLVPDAPILRNLRGGPTAWLEDLAARRGGKSLSPQYAKAGGEGALKRPNALRRAWGEVKGLFGPFDRIAKHQPWALPGVVRFAKRQKCELIYANAGPFSALLMAEAVRRLTGLPMVLDLRDPWSLEPNYRASWTRSGLRLVEWMEAGMFRRAEKVILNTASTHAAYVSHYEGRIPADRFTYIRNQFDPALYAAPGPAPEAGEPFRVVYFGHLRASKNARLFLEALARFMREAGLGAGDVELVMLGSVTDADKETYQRLGLSEIVELRDWLPFTRSPELLGTADVLLDLMGPKHHLQISGKLYDYLAAGRPILSISPNTELDAIYAQTGAGQRVDLDEDQIVAALRDRYERRFEPFEPSAEGIAAFTAEAAADKTATIFDEAIR